MDFTWDFICTGEILEGNFMLGWHHMILASGFHSLEEILQQMAEIEGKLCMFDNCIVCVIWEKRLCTQDIWHAKELDLLCPAVWNVFWLETTSVTTYSNESTTQICDTTSASNHSLLHILHCFFITANQCTDNLDCKLFASYCFWKE